MERESGWVYLIKPVGHNIYKIGYTTNLEQRLKQNSKKIGKPVEYVHFFHTDNCQYAEQEVHAMFRNSHLVSEWYTLSDEEVSKFKGLGGQ